MGRSALPIPLWDLSLLGSVVSHGLDASYPFVDYLTNANPPLA